MTLSLAGRTAVPAPQPVPVRVGGFGGAEGLAHYLTSERIDALIDATHPYAATISANAAYAAQQARTPMLALRRLPWIATAGDHWIEVPDVVTAVRALGNESRRVFLALGRKELAPFVGAPQHHYLVRSVEPVDPPLALPHAAYLTARGPFDEADERALLERNRIAVIVAKTFDALLKPVQEFNPKVPDRLGKLVQHCLAFNAHKRPESMAEIHAELEAISEGLIHSPEDRLEASEW